MFFQGSCYKKFHRITRERHCMKSVQIKTFSGPYFLYLDLMRRLRSKSPYSVRIQENTDQKKLRIWKVFLQSTRDVVLF